MCFLFLLSFCMLVQTKKVSIPGNREPPEARAEIVLVKTPINSTIAFFGGHSDKIYFNDLLDLQYRISILG